MERARCADRRACNAVFGDGDPNTEYEEKRWKMVCHILVIHVLLVKLVKLARCARGIQLCDTQLLLPCKHQCLLVLSQLSWGMFA